jgi:hypothetical protein
MRNLLAGWFAMAVAVATMACGDDSTAADTGAVDTGAVDSGAVTSTACMFPVTVVTPNSQVFVCHAASPTECEVTTSTSMTDACTDSSVPDWMFLLEESTGELQAPNWMFTNFDAGTAIDGASTLTDIPDVTPVSTIIVNEGVDHDLELSLDITASSVTITSFAVSEMRP